MEKDMLTGYYTGVSGIYYNQQRLDATTNNLANVDTTGFKRSIFVEKTRAINSNTNLIDPQVLKRLPKFYGLERSGVFKSFETGATELTDNPLDLAIGSNLENAFFSVKTPGSNNGEVFYTRNGTLSIGHEDPSNTKSDTVLYMAGHVLLDDSGSSIPLDPSAGSLSVEGNGTLMQGETSLGFLPVFRFDKKNEDSSLESSNLNQLLSLGNSLFQVPKGLEKEFIPTEIEIEEGKIDSIILQGVKEGSNVSVMTEMMTMMDTSKSIEASTRSLQKQMENLTKLFQEVRS
jgi:flagellar basal-body rod protein FlgF